MFYKKYCDPSACCKCRDCSTMKTEKECLCCQEVEAVHDFILQGIFVLSQAKILSELQKQSHRCVLQKRCSQKFCKISQNTFSYRTLSVATPGITHNLLVTSISFVRNFAMNFAKFLRKHFLTEHLWWLLLDITHNLVISIPSCFCNQTWFQNCCHM